MLLALIGLMAGGLLGVAVSSARVAARALAETSPTRSSKDWLSPVLPAGVPGLLWGEPAGPQGEDAHRIRPVIGRVARMGRPAGPSHQLVDASRLCEGSRSSGREGTAFTPRTPNVPPRRERRNPSAGWTRLSNHAPHNSCHIASWTDWDQLQGPVPPRSQGTDDRPRPPREEGEEQWTWG